MNKATPEKFDPEEFEKKFRQDLKDKLEKIERKYRNIERAIFICSALIVIGCWYFILFFS